MTEQDHLKIEAAMYYGFEPVDIDDLPQNITAGIDTAGDMVYVCTEEQILALVNAVMGDRK